MIYKDKMSYRKVHVKSKVNRIKPKKSIFKNRWFWLVILFLVLIFLCVYFFLFCSGVQVKNIIISGNQKIQNQDIENLVKDAEILLK